MNSDVVNLVLIIGICFIGYIFLIRFNVVEGMTVDASNNTRPAASASSSVNGIAGNAATFAANLKAASVKLSDTLLVTKYRSDYESAIMNAEELVKNLMLKTTLSVDPSKPHDSIAQLVALSQAQVALNLVMKFVDSS